MRLINKEEWREVKDFPSYMVSNLGRVKHLGRIYYTGNHNSKRIVKEHIIPENTIKGGYKRVMLRDNGKMKSFLVHRLVAMAFIPNQDNLSEVNHKDENPSNNCIENLEWCSSKYNSNYGNRNKKASLSLTNGKRSKPINQFTKDGLLIASYPSMQEAQRQTGYSQGNISNCCNGRCKQSYGYIWKYA